MLQPEQEMRCTAMEALAMEPIGSKFELPSYEKTISVCAPTTAGAAVEEAGETGSKRKKRGGGAGAGKKKG